MPYRGPHHRGDIFFPRHVGHDSKSIATRIPYRFRNLLGAIKVSIDNDDSGALPREGESRRTPYAGCRPCHKSHLAAA
jgi:hypothetical protein